MPRPVPDLDAIRARSATHPFWSNVALADDENCWPWKGKLDQHGYGYQGRERTHRIAWELSRRESLKAGSVVRHTCDNPRCCNPSHLVVGSQEENIADRVERERGARGTGNGRAVLSEADVLSIYRSDGRREDVARSHGVSVHTVIDIRCGRTWSWLTGHSKV